jgi:hypothetical protein
VLPSCPEGEFARLSIDAKTRDTPPLEPECAGIEGERVFHRF